MNNTIKLIAARADSTPASGQFDTKNTLQIANDSDVLPLAAQLQGIECVELHFPAFTDGRAFSQAFLLRRRLGFQGDIRATGDVLIDQLLQMQRCGFSSAVLRADQNLAHGEKLLAHYSAFYQGDADNTAAFFKTA
jgi:uncharacterized protein (DUF934 family)